MRNFNKNKSSTAGRKTRPGTYGNKSAAPISEKVVSQSNFHPNESTHSQKRLMTSYNQKRSESRRHLGQKKKSSKEQEILITKTYDLLLEVAKKSNHKKISYVNKDEHE
jgi:hypothetical protein